jgi:glycosyltransferase involved in cell wall biosynthesis
MTVRAAARRVGPLVTRRWPPASRLFLVGEGAGWVIDEELASVGRLARLAGVRVADRRLLSLSQGQAVLYGSHFTLLAEPWRPPPHLLGTTYFHGRPGTPGMPDFDEPYRLLRAHHEELHRIQVSHSELEAIVLESGIDPAKVFRIPIGIEPAHFTPVTPELRREARRTLGLPDGAFVVGSFQKDGVGWGEGDTPKLVKGPDLLADALERVHRDVPELHVLLSGPARGYVRGRLERAGIPVVHRLREHYADVGPLYHALDAYLVSSRQEGGPKAVLESMASAVPLVTTRVGQAMDLVRHRENAYLVEPEDVEGMAAWLVHVAGRPAELDALAAAGLATVAEHTYDAQLPLWRSFFAGFADGR